MYRFSSCLAYKSQLSSPLFDIEIGVLVSLKIVDSRSHFLLTLLEDVEAVQVEEHGGNQSSKQAHSPEIRMRTLVVLEHDKALPVTHFMLSQYLSVVFRDLRLLTLEVTLVKLDVVFLSGRVVVLLHLLDVVENFFFLVVGVKSYS